MKYNSSIISAALLCAAVALPMASCSNDPEFGEKAEEAIMASGITVDVDLNYPLAVGMSKKVNATIDNSDSVTVKTIVWSSSNTNVATVTQDGEITALTTGKADIYLTQEGNTGATTTIALTVMPKAEAMQLENLDVFEGTTTAIKANLTPADAYNVMEWSSSDASTATVDGKGNVTGVKPGKVTITAKSTDGSNLIATAEVEVKKVVPIETMSLVEPGYALRPGDIAKIDCKLTPADASAQLLTWTSSDENVATVDRNGTVTAVSNGVATIKAKDPISGKEESVAVTVAYVASWTISNYSSWNDLKNLGWSVGNGATAEIIDGMLHVEAKDQGGKYRGDIAFMDGQHKLTLDPQTYRYMAIAMDPPGVKGKRSIKLDFSGPNGRGDYGAEPTEFVEGKTKVACWDLLSKDKNPSGQLNTFQIKMADIKAEPYFYNIYWIRTFKTMDELNEYVNKYWK